MTSQKGNAWPERCGAVNVLLLEACTYALAKWAGLLRSKASEEIPTIRCRSPPVRRHSTARKGSGRCLSS